MPNGFFDSDRAGASRPGSGLFGQTTFDKATGSTQSLLYDASRPAPASEPIKGSKNALDPRHTGKLFDQANRTATTMPTAEAGHWVTLEDGRHILIRDSLGSGKGFSRAALHRKLVAHHEELHGTGGYSHTEADEWENAGRGHSQTVFHKKLPGEVKRYLQGNRHAARLFRVTQDAAKAGGADALGDLGEDRYFSHVDKMSGSNVKAALETARGSDDPEMRFLAAVHDNLPDSGARKNMATIPAGKLKAGQRFTAGGIPVRVVEDADGFKVLSGIGEDVPVDALKEVPIDRGSLRMHGGKLHRLKSDAVAPFSRAAATTGLALSGDPDDGDGHWRTVDGAHVFIKGGEIKQGPSHLVGHKVGGKSGFAKALGDHPHLEKNGVKHVEGSAESVNASLTKHGFQKLTPEHRDYFGKAIKQHEGRDVHQYRNVKTGKVHLVAPRKGGGSKEGGAMSRDVELSGLILSGLDAAFTMAGDGAGLPKDRNGVPCHFYWKEMLRPGLRFRDKNGREQVITPQRIQTLASCYSRAAANGFEACLPLGSHNPEEAPNAGWLHRVEVRDDGSLWGLHQFLGDAERVKGIVASNKSSIGTINDYEDEKGNIYPELIVHDAILPHPRLSGLKDFTPALAASRGQAIAWLELSLAAPTKEVQMDLSSLRSKLGAAASVPDEQLPGLAVQRISTLETEAGKVTVLTNEKTELSNKVQTLNLELSRAKPKPTARELHFASKAVAQARKAAIHGGAITVGVADAAEKRFLKKNVDLGKMELSRTVEEDDHTVADGLTNLLDFYESVAGNKPAPKPGEHSGKQDLSLSREVPGANGGEGDNKGGNPLLETAKKMRGIK